ncbi:hypothetical protein DPMN_005323 [Dreissena polymorpha]|uniref:Uncharacterized protein n=1 Tax=Dreissena polymorpha TaxID=45954 RepID=A0A9D4MUD4_DREPO|nr:hypothetical protein DPMN_005323 [Dreissena polymorpha]
MATLLSVMDEFVGSLPTRGAFSHYLLHRHQGNGLDNVPLAIELYRALGSQTAQQTSRTRERVEKLAHNGHAKKKLVTTDQSIIRLARDRNTGRHDEKRFDQPLR